MAHPSAERGISFPHRAQLVRQADDPSFQGVGADEGPGKHVVADDVALDIVQLVVFQGVVQRETGMADAVEPMPLHLLMPIVKKIVMQQGTDNQAPLVDMQMQRMDNLELVDPW